MTHVRLTCCVCISECRSHYYHIHATRAATVCHDSDIVMTRLWEEGQHEATAKAFALGIRPPSLSEQTDLACDWKLHLPDNELWYATPWTQEQAAMALMRPADEIDNGDVTGVGIHNER